MAFGLADLGAMQGRADAFDDAVEAAETVRTRYGLLWDELHLVPELSPDDRHAVRARIRRLNELGFAVDEISLEPTSGGEALRLRVAVANRRFHARELARLTGLVALEGQARLLLNDLREYQAWLEYELGLSMPMDTAAEQWLHDVLEPSLATLAPAIGPTRDPLQAYCDVLEQKWLLSEAAGRDVGLETALDAYLALGAPAPEDATAASSIALDIDWSAASTRRPSDAMASCAGAGVPVTIRVMTTDGAVAAGPVIRVRGLVKRYGDLVAVDGIDFDVAAGEVFGLLGPNGAGKTTTVEILEGLRTPDAGEVSVLGDRRGTRCRSAQAAHRGQPPDGVDVPEAHGRRGHRPVPQLLSAIPPDRRADRHARAR